MPLDRRRFLAALSAGFAVPSLARAEAPKRLVVVFAEGGWDVSFCMDPKFSSDLVDGPQVDEDPGDPDDRESLRTFAEIPIAVNDRKRPAVTAFFERWAPQTAVINGIWMGALAHATARVRVLTGTQSEVNPAFAAIAGDRLGDALPLGSVDLSGGSYSGSLASSTGQVGYQSQIQALLLDGVGFPAAPGFSAGAFQADAAQRDQLRAYLAARQTAVRPRWSDGGRNDVVLDGRIESLVRAGRFRADGAEAIAQLQLGASPSLIQQADLAVDFLAGDLCRAVTLDSRRFWDTHDGNDLQHANYQALFEGLDHLVAELDTSGLLASTMVVVLSEFTRTPKLNSSLGKDHWPYASFLVAGAGVRGGRVVGASDDSLQSLPVDLATGEADDGGVLNKYDNVAAGVLAALDVDPGPWYPGVTPFTAPFVT